MPPWKANDACRPLSNSRRLSDADKNVITDWVRSGMLEGEKPLQLPVPPEPLRLPRVDVTLAMAAPYVPKTARPDDYRCFVLDPQLPGERDIVGYDITPGQRSLVHHVLLYGLPRSEALSLDAREAGEGYSCFGGPGGSGGTVYGGWAPGASATHYPEDTGITMETDKVIVMQVHYNTAHGAHGGSIGADTTSLSLMLAPTKVAKPAVLLPLADLNFTIPPFTPTSTSVTFPLPIGATLYGIGPHMHTRGRSIQVTSDEGCLVDVPQWDFNWQQLYRFETPVALKAGTRLKLTCTWDNPTNVTVRWGEGTDDEMCLSFLYLTR